MKILSSETLIQASIVGANVVVDIVNNKENKRSPQVMFNELHQAKNN